MSRRTATFVKLSAIATFAASALVWSASAPAGPPVCPKIYAPVICDNGKVYVNQCYADRHNAKNCVPTGDL